MGTKNKKKLVILAPLGERYVQKMKDTFEELEVVWKPNVSKEEESVLLKDACICIGEPDWDALTENDSLKLLQMTWAGTDKYTRAGRKFPDGISLCSASGAFGSIISQYVCGAVLAIYQNFSKYQEQKGKHIWRELKAARSFLGTKAMIFGTGDIGSHVAWKLRGIGVSDITGVRRGTETPDGFDRVCSFLCAEKFLKDMDLVINCMPNTDENQSYLSRERLLSMKRDAVLVNVGRGAFVDDLALAEVLQSGHLFGAVLDVTEPEPLPKDHPLWECERLILTPHIAGPSFGNAETEEKIAEICIENIRRYINGEKLKNLVIKGK